MEARDLIVYLLYVPKRRRERQLERLAVEDPLLGSMLVVAALPFFFFRSSRQGEDDDETVEIRSREFLGF